MSSDDTKSLRCAGVADDDNNPASDPAAVDVALTRIAEAIGRHIAREHIRAAHAANDKNRSLRERE